MKRAYNGDGLMVQRVPCKELSVQNYPVENERSRNIICSFTHQLDFSIPFYLEIDYCSLIPEVKEENNEAKDYTLYQISLPKEYYDTQLHFKVRNIDGTYQIFIRNCCKFRVASLGDPLRALFHEKWTSSSPLMIQLESERELIAFDISLSFSHSVKPKNVPCSLLVATIRVASYWLMFPVFSWIFKELSKKTAAEVSLYEALEILETDIPPEVVCANELKALAVRVVIDRFEELMREAQNYLALVSFQTIQCLLNKVLQCEPFLNENDKFTVVFMWLEKDVKGRLKYLPELVKMIDFGAFDGNFCLDVVSSRAKLYDWVMDPWMGKLFSLKFSQEVSYVFKRILRIIATPNSNRLEMNDCQYCKGFFFYWNLVWDLIKKTLVFKVGVVPELLKNQEEDYLLPIEVEGILPDFDKTERVQKVMKRKEAMTFKYDNIGAESKKLNFMFKINTFKEVSYQ